MREIKFRAQRVDGERDWVYGFYYEEYEQPNDICYTQGYIVDKEGDIWQVDPETVSEYIGRKDKKGKEIYGGDIVKAYHYEFKEKNIGIVIYKDFCYQLKQLKQSKQALEHGYIDCIRYWSDGSHDWYSMEQYEKEDLEVIGNIHENSELLEG